MESTINSRTYSTKINIGVSSCLLGNNVRYDGQNKFNKNVVELIENKYNAVAICPEFESGLGVPRPPITLQLKDFSKKLKSSGISISDLEIIEVNNTSKIHTEKMRLFCEKNFNLFKTLSGFISKSGSPSCALKFSYQNNLSANPRNEGPGYFVLWLSEHFPGLPIIDEILIEDSTQRKNFFQSIENYILLNT